MGGDAIDRQPTKAFSKSRSVVGLPQCYLPLRSTGEIAGETPPRAGALRARAEQQAARDFFTLVHEPSERTCNGQEHDLLMVRQRRSRLITAVRERWRTAERRPGRAFVARQAARKDLIL